MVERKTIIDRLFRLTPRTGVTNIVELSQLTIREFGEACTLADEEFIFRYRRSIWNSLFELQDKMIHVGIDPYFHSVDQTRYLLRWNLCDGLSSKKKWQARNRAKILRLLYSLNDRQYEYACGLACKLSGGMRVAVTPKGGEFGIDFVALLPAYGGAKAICAGVNGLRIVGQAKMYNSPVPREKVQALTSVITSVKERRPEIVSILPGWFFTSKSPIIGWIVGHSGFQSGSIQYGGDHGIVLSDSIELADMLTIPKCFSYSNNESEIEEKFKESLKLFAND
jgi:hypothetical protein